MAMRSQFILNKRRKQIFQMRHIETRMKASALKFQGASKTNDLKNFVFGAIFYFLYKF